MTYDKPGCKYYTASGQCPYDEGSEECRKCSFKQCLEDIASDYEKNAAKVFIDYKEDVAEVVIGFLEGERKAMEVKSGVD